MTAVLFPVDQNDLDFLRSQWNDLLSSFPTDRDSKESFFQILKEKYSEKNRFYHNLSHVRTMLNLHASFNHKVQNSQAIQFSIWFHDAVYNTERTDNEEESARFASESLEILSVPTETVEVIRDLILATKHHSGADLSDDAKLFLDMDLAILGMQEEIYRKYSQAIRNEYSWVPETTYRDGRRKILMNFMSRERIYFTEDLTARFEEQARKNMNREIALLAAE